MIPVALAAVLAGDLVMYLAGRGGRRLVRAALLVAAGAARIPLARPVACDGVAAAAGAALWISVGVRLAAHLERARAIAGQARGVVLVLAAVALVVLAARRLAMPRRLS